MSLKYQIDPLHVIFVWSPFLSFIQIVVGNIFRSGSYQFPFHSNYGSPFARDWWNEGWSATITSTKCVTSFEIQIEIENKMMEKSAERSRQQFKKRTAVSPRSPQMKSTEDDRDTCFNDILVSGYGKPASDRTGDMVRERSGQPYRSDTRCTRRMRRWNGGSATWLLSKENLLVAVIIIIEECFSSLFITLHSRWWCGCSFSPAFDLFCLEPTTTILLQLLLLCVAFLFILFSICVASECGFLSVCCC